jgi:hypothetical protein
MNKRFFLNIAQQKISQKNKYFHREIEAILSVKNGFSANFQIKSPNKNTYPGWK